MDEEGNHWTLLFRSQIQTSASGRMIPTNNDVCEREHVCACVPYTTAQLHSQTQEKILFTMFTKILPIESQLTITTVSFLFAVDSFYFLRKCSHSIINFGLLLMKQHVKKNERNIGMWRRYSEFCKSQTVQPGK